MRADRQQFNVTLAPDLVRRVKHHAIDVQLSLSDLLARVLENELAATEDPVHTDAGPTDQPAAPDVRLRPMVHVADMPAAVAFYEQLGAHVVHGSRDGDWVLLQLGGGQLGLLAHPPNPEQDEGRVELNFQAPAGSLDALEERLRTGGVAIARPTSDEGFGRQLQISSPDGLLVKIDELEPDLFT